jgi:hypothetical protein
MRKFCLAALVLLVTAVPALADSVKGSILAFDRVARVIVLDDKTVWPLGPAEIEMPGDLKAGDVIVIEFKSEGDSGLGKVISITRSPA